jgi:two-component system, NarL family, nitrate/nitrite response regulator NarL
VTNGTPAETKRERKIVLVVDVSRIIREKLVGAFLSAGFETCREATNGKEAIELARELRPDVIMLDFSMPIMNGLETASVLRRTLPETPIILFTLFADTLSNADVSEAGISLVLGKGTPLRALTDKAHELLRR